MPKIDIKTITEFDPSLTEPIGRLLDQLTSLHIEFTDNDLRTLIEAESSSLMVMYSDTEPIGMITLGHYLAPTGRKVWIEDVVIDNMFRGRGLGRKLVAHAIEYCKSQGIDTLMLTSNPKRVAANALYQSLGFERKETNVYKMNLL